MQTKLLFFTLFVFSCTSLMMAQPGPPPDPGCWPPPCVPIDGGISLLIAAGAIYGGKKLYSKQKHKKNNL